MSRPKKGNPERPVRKISGSFMVAIPKFVAQKAGIKEGETFVFDKDGNAIRKKASSLPRLTFL